MPRIIRWRIPDGRVLLTPELREQIIEDRRRRDLSQVQYAQASPVGLRTIQKIERGALKTVSGELVAFVESGPRAARNGTDG
jgi:hypothetical protein